MSSLSNSVSASSLEAETLRKLGLLALLKQGLPPYYQALMREEEELLRVGAMSMLLELHAIWSSQVDLVLANAHRGAIKRRAFMFFMSVLEYGVAQKIAETESDNVDALLSARMQAEIRLDYAQMTELDLQLFLAHGVSEYLWSADKTAERFGGWRAGFPIILNMLLLRPMDPNGPFRLLTMLRTANETALLEKVCDCFASAQIYRLETELFRAALLADRGAHEDALKKLEGIPPNAPNVPANTLNLQLRAESQEALGRYHDSYSTYQWMNKVGQAANNIDPKLFYKAVQKRTSYRFVSVEDDPRTAAYLTMLGFPRSGTTLLENALASHPKIETFEEISTLSRMELALDRFVQPSGIVQVTTARDARDRYFDELGRHGTKPEATIKIDKMPLYAADGPFFRNMLPSMRFIFSIRHPYDVVLSCFRQDFAPNRAMENFRTIADAAALYDFTMSQWFSVHSLVDDPSVVYVRYEDLVENFKPTVERVLAFMDVEWDDSVHGFVEAAGRRQAKTPSYKKVRSGLGIGVQSSRDRYAFLFDTKETAVLKRWVKHFGYSG